jgi:hypothetical protein
MTPTENKSNPPTPVPKLSIVPTPEERIDRALDFIARIAIQRAKEILACREHQSTAG